MPPTFTSFLFRDSLLVLKTVFIFSLFLCCAVDLQAQNSFMTFNLRYDNANDKDNAWGNRRFEVSEMIQHYQPDILGIQEGLVQQVKYLDSVMSDYDYVGVGREDGKTQGEYSAIFYNKKKMKLVDSKTYWLSPTPDKVSKGWDAALERIVTFGCFVDRKKKDTLYVFNCHMDHIGKKAREESAKLILHLIDSMKIWNQPLVVMGDFNSEPEEAAVQLFQQKLETSNRNGEAILFGPEGTFNGFDTEKAVTKRIDYIFIKNMKFSMYDHIDDKRKNNLWLSDHLPVFARVF